LRKKIVLGTHLLLKKHSFSSSIISFRKIIKNHIEKEIMIQSLKELQRLIFKDYYITAKSKPANAKTIIIGAHYITET